MKKNKVLIIVENASVPFDTRVWKEALSLKQAGYDVAILCPRDKDGLRAHEILNGIPIYRHPAPAEAGGALGYLFEYGSALFWETLYAWWIFLRHGFHVIQGCNPPDDIFLIAQPFKLFGVKYIFDHHDASPELFLTKFAQKGALYKLAVALERWTYRFSDAVMCTNASYKDLAIERGGVKPQNVFIVRNGPERERFRPVPAEPALKYGKPFLVGYVGTMGSQDGLDILVEVAAHLKQLGRRDIHFTCVGAGPCLASLREMVRDKELGGIMNFTGRIPDDQMIGILSTADVCVNPDRPCAMNDISTMIKIMEYMALGKPIVQFESKEGRFSAGRASLYADPRNQIADFASKIVWLLENPDERERMGRLGRQRVDEELAWEYSVPNLLAAYAKCLQGKSSSLDRTLRSAVGRSASGSEMELGSDQGNRSMVLNSFYSVKPLIPRRIQIELRRRRARCQSRHAGNIWPIWDATAAAPPAWRGWPDGKRFALVLTHDVEGESGLRRCEELAAVEESRGLRSAFGFVPLRYETPEPLRRTLSERGFEVMVHDLYHDGKLYRDRQTFLGRRGVINEFLGQWETRGFSSGAMHHNLPWISELDIDYGISTYDVDPFEPQSCGLGRIFPFWVQAPAGGGAGFVEMPYTLPQDFTLFVLMGERNNSIWRRKLDWIAEKGGMALIKTHPDYMVFPDERKRMEGYPVEWYADFLDYVGTSYENDVWITTPSAVSQYWRSLASNHRETAEKISWHETFCKICRKAHEEGWLNNFPSECSGQNPIR